MSGGFFRGTSADQDTRFSNKQAKLLKSQKFSPVLDQLVDMTKVKMDVMKPWIATRATELLGFEDEVLINFIYGLLDGKGVDGKQIQIQLTGFMEKNTGKFMRELWGLLLSAQSNVSGVPQQFLDAKEEETRKKKEESDKITQEIQKRMDRDGRRPERERKSRFGDEADMSKFTKDASGGIGSKITEPRGSSMERMDGESNKRQDSLPGNRRSRTPPPKNQSPSLRTIPSPTTSNDKKSMSRSRSVSEERHRRRSLSVSSQSPKRPISPRKRYISPNRRSLSPRRRYRSPHRSRYRSPRDSRSPPRRRSAYITQRSPSPYRGRSPIPRRRSPRRRSPSPVRRRSPSPLRRRSSPVRRRSPSPVQHRSPSPVRRRSPSPVRRRSPSPVRRRSPSPVRRRSPSPVRRRSPSPVRRRAPSPVRRRSSSPVRRRTPSPVRRRSPSPIRRRSPSPVRRRSPSPVIYMSPSLVRRRSPTPVRRMSPSPVRRRSPSPKRRRSPSPVRRRSPKKAQGSPSPSVSPIPRSPKRRRSPHKPDNSSSPRRSPMSRSSRRREPSPMRSPGYHPADSSLSPPQRKRGGEKSPAKVSASVSHKMQFSLRSPQHDAVSKSKTNKKSPIPSPECSLNLSGSPTDMRVEDGRIRRRSPNLSKSPIRKTRKEEHINHDREVMHNRNTGSGRTSKDSPRDMKPEPYSPKRNFSRSPELGNDKRRKRELSPIDEHAQTHNLPNSSGAEKVPAKARHERGPREYVNDTKQKGGNGNNDYNERHHEPKQATLPKKGMDSDSEDSYKNDNVGRRRSKKPDKHKRDEEETSESDSEVEHKKEAKRKRREEKRLRREERHKKREERHKRKLERRASKLKLKSVEKDTSDADDSESEQRRLEIELREKALESLRAKKGISR